MSSAHDCGRFGIYVVLVDNPMNFPADAFVGSNWYHLGQLEAEAAVKACDGKSKQIGGQVTVRESGNPPSVDFKTSGTWYELFFEVS